MKKMPPPRYPGTEIEINALHLPPALHTEWEEAADEAEALSASPTVAPLSYLHLRPTWSHTHARE